MPITTFERNATIAEMAVEIDRRGAVIEKLESEVEALRKERDNSRANSVSRGKKLLVAEPGEPVAWPKELVCVPDPSEPDARIVGFRIREGDEAWGETGLSDPLFWLKKACRRTAPPARQDGALREAAQALADQWTHYRERTTLNQQDAYWTLAKGQWGKWDALLAAIAQSAAPVQPEGN